MTAESLQAAQQLDEQISALAQRHAASQLAKNTLTGVSARPDALLHQVRIKDIEGELDLVVSQTILVCGAPFFCAKNHDQTHCKFLFWASFRILS